VHFRLKKSIFLDFFTVFSILAYLQVFIADFFQYYDILSIERCFQINACNQSSIVFQAKIVAQGEFK
jgi:hypothetical protein